MDSATFNQYFTNIKQYLTNIGHAFLNRKEHFNSGPATSTETSATSIESQSLAVVVLVIIMYSLIAILNMYGAGRLSFCYNRYYGTDSGTTWVFAILSAIFSPIYYPFYALFLNPLCSLQRAGGKR